jgi:hypothetical protein
MLVVINMLMMATVIRRPVKNVILKRARSTNSKNQPDAGMCLVCFMRPKAMIAGGNGDSAKPHV